MTLDSSTALRQWLLRWPDDKNPFTLAAFPLILWPFLAPYFVRKQLLRNRDSISPVLPNNGEDYERLFGRISNLRGQLVSWAVLGVALYPVSPSGRSILGGSAVSIPQLVLDVGVLIVYGIALGSLVWTCISSLKGIHDMGALSLQLRPFYDDPTLGLRPIGSLAMSLELVLFGEIGLTIIFSTLLILTSTVLLGVVLSFVLLALVMFFLPMRRLHHRMLQQKTLETNSLRQKFGEVYQNSKPSDSVSDMAGLFRLDMMRKDISAMAVWPFDGPILGRLTVIVLTVIATLIARGIATFLHI